MSLIIISLEDFKINPCLLHTIPMQRKDTFLDVYTNPFGSHLQLNIIDQEQQQNTPLSYDISNYKFQFLK